MNIFQTLGNWARQHLGGHPLDFAVAVGLVAVATLVNLWAWPTGSSGDGHYFTLMTAVLISALYGGAGPGLVAAVLGGFSSSFFTLSPQFSINVAAPAARGRLGLFITEALCLNLAAPVVRHQLRSRAPSVGFRRYLAIPFAVGAATVPKLVFPDLARELPFAFNYAAVCTCAWIGGLLPGIAATVLLAGITRFLFFDPIYSMSVASQVDNIRIGLFGAEGLLLALLGSSHTRLKGVAANASARARTYIAAALNREVDSTALRAVSRDTVWEWDVDTGEIGRTPGTQDEISAALPARESFAAWIERIHPEDREATVTRLQQAIAAGREEVQYTYRLLDPSGTFLSVWDHAFIIRGADWRPLRVIGRSAELPPSRLPAR